MIPIDWGSSSLPGVVRSHNEDNLLARSPVFVVADGMGGHAAGEVASRLVVEEFQRLAQAAPISSMDVLATLRSANAAVLSAGELSDQAGMGTTVVGLAMVEEAGSRYWMAFNIGDSRLYRCIGGQVEQLSVDHSALQEMVDAGAVAAGAAGHHPHRHVLTRAVGTDPAPAPNFCLLVPTPGERFLLCSDGVSTDLTPQELLRLLSLPERAEAVAQSLVAAARSAGSTDDSTALVVDVLGAEDASVDDSTVPRPPTVAGHGAP